MRFRYPRTNFAIRSIGFLAILACILFIMGMADIDINWLLGFSIVYFLAVLITTITPIFTYHEIDDEKLLIRNGMVFSTGFPYEHIEAVEKFSSGKGILGPVSKGGRIVLASSNKGLVMIKLNHKKRFGMLLMRKADEIIIDLEKPDEFIKLANEYLNQTRASPGRLS